MARIEQKRIRRIYYAGNMIIILATAILIFLPILINLQKESDRKIQQLRESIINQKEFLLRNIIFEKISDIEQIDRRLREATPGISETELEKSFRDEVYNMIHNTSLPDDGYIWINEIVDFQGGENYAIRFVHPNLVDTEGSYLSTETEDIKGNKPYLTELEGIKKEGEVFLEYYFQKMNSQEISHKMSYGKLYEPYNWVVATGVYLDDVDALVQMESRKMEESNKETTRRILLIMFSSVSVLIIIITVFEFKIQQMITLYLNHIDQYNHKLEEEKEKLETAYERIEEMAYKDSLTDLFNRRAMFNYLEDEFARFTRTGIPFGLLMCDIDWFKKINDRYGHPTGDCVLKGLADILIKKLRKEDKVCRWGGEEFLCLITGSHQENLKEVAEKLRKDIEQSEFEYNGNKLKITLTIGCAVSQEGTSIETLIDKADALLYKGKQSGRNKVMG